MKAQELWGGVVAAVLIAVFFSGCATQDAWIEQDGHSFRIVRAPRARETDVIEQAWRDLEAAEKQYGPDHPEIALGLEHLAGLHKELGDYAEAERLYREALALAERLYWPEHPEVGKACNNLAVACDLQGKSVEAERLFKRALSALAKSLGLEDPDTLVVLDNLGDFYMREGRYKDAELILKRLVQLRRKALGRTHPETSAAEADLENLRTLSARTTERRAPQPEPPLDLGGPVGW